jgi:RNA polymerase sigma-70 factor (ECF subfamily)
MSKDILTTVFTSLRKNFLKQAQRILASEEDAEDVVQDAFCKLWRSDYTLKTTNEAEALARTTIRNLSLDELRKQEVRPQFSLDTERDTVLQRSALEEIEIRERFEQVETIIEAELSPSERRVMHLKEYEGHSFEEIAEMMHLTEAAVRMKLSRARKRIRTVCQEQNKKEGGSYDYQ